ncbi:MAG TPA: hypothetical protein P5525_23380 [Candidatus Paceibacterota bacterium]|nr:hypothetical protein [Candidatus Paceibacterota bacterium]
MKHSPRPIVAVATKVLALLSLSFASSILAQTGTTTSAVRFQSQLHQQLSTFAWDAGWASFQVEGGQLQFQVFLDAYFSNLCGVALLTDSRQATVQMETGQFMLVPMCDPVLVPGSDPPVFISRDGLRAVTYHAGSIPLNETLLQELVAGQGEVYFHLPAPHANGPYWDVPPPVQGRLLQVPGGDVASTFAGLAVGIRRCSSASDGLPSIFRSSIFVSSSRVSAARRPRWP